MLANGVRRLTINLKLLGGLVVVSTQWTVRFLRQAAKKEKDETLDKGKEDTIVGEWMCEKFRFESELPTFDVKSMKSFLCEM